MPAVQHYGSQRLPETQAGLDEMTRALRKNAPYRDALQRIERTAEHTVRVTIGKSAAEDVGETTWDLALICTSAMTQGTLQIFVDPSLTPDSQKLQAHFKVLVDYELQNILDLSAEGLRIELYYGQALLFPKAA